MTITGAVAITSLVALVVHLFYLRRMWLNRQEQRVSLENGNRQRIARTFFRMEATRFVINFCWAAGTVGILLGQRQLGYLLALAPVLSIVSSSIALRGIR